MQSVLFKTLFFAAVASLSFNSVANDAVSLDELLKNVKSGQAADRKAAAEREKRFNVDKNAQQNLLKQMQSERTRQEALSQRLETEF